MDFKKIIDDMDEFESIEFNVHDIVRSGLVKSYLISKINLGFKHLNLHNFPELKATTTKEGRRYRVGDTFYPSVTTVIGHSKKKSIMEWRNRVGEEEIIKFLNVLLLVVISAINLLNYTYQNESIST